MNVIDAIKGTILNVPKDITSGIKSLTTRESVSENEESDDEYFIEQQGINYDAGAELLNKFQADWSELHQKSEENAKKAKNVDSQISELYVYLERQNDAVNQFLMEISSLPQLLTDLQSVTSKIDNLEGQFEVIESELLMLEDVCEEQELRRNQQHHQYQLETYRQRRSTELEQAKVQLAKQHAVKVQRYEQHLQRSLRDRQQAFEATFREEVHHYKKYGKVSPLIERKVSTAEDATDISEFIPEEDASALDDFLKTDPSSSGPKEEAASANLDVPPTSEDQEVSENKSTEVSSSYEGMESNVKLLEADDKVNNDTLVADSGNFSGTPCSDNTVSVDKDSKSDEMAPS